MDNTCFHCHLPISGPVRFHARIEGVDQPMCCPGCQAVARAIVSGGLGRYYDYRTEPAQQAEPLQREAYALYDRADLQSRFVHDLPSDPHPKKEARLLVEGVSCAACVWLLEHHLRALEGIEGAWVNLSQHRLRVVFDPEKIPVSRIMQTVRAIGYKPHPWQPESLRSLEEKEKKAAARRLAVAGLGAMQVMMYAVALYAGALQGMASHHRDLLRLACALISIPVVLYAAQPFFLAAWRDLRNRRPGMDVPVSLAIGSAWLASLWATWQGTGEVYFDSVSMFTFFLLTGRWLEMRVRHARDSTGTDLHSLLPETCLRKETSRENSWEQTTPSDLRPGDLVRILAGDSIPADGRILNGQSAVDEAALTGEHFPVSRGPGDSVHAGTINTENTLEVEVTQAGGDTRLSAISRLLEQARAEKPALVQLADRVSGWFVSSVLLLSLAVLLYWLQQRPEDAFWIMLSVLVATCPCALSLATPAAMAAATCALQARGFLVCRGHTLGTLVHITHVVFDKTGTLTQGKLRLDAIKVLDDTRTKEEVLDLAAALEAHSRHPLASAFPQPRQPIAQVRNRVGLGLEANIGQQLWRLGQPRFACPAQQLTPPDSRHSWLLLSCDAIPKAWFGLTDSLRPDARQTVQRLRAAGLHLSLLSGDSKAVVAHTARQLGFDSWTAGASPEDKLHAVNQRQARGERVLMVGDGINDIPVLAAADLAVTMNNAADLTRVQADGILLSDDLSLLPDSLALARKARRVVVQGIVWALGYNLLVLPLAACGLLPPWMAALGMSASSLLVVINALRLAPSGTGPQSGGRPAAPRPSQGTTRWKVSTS